MPELARQPARAREKQAAKRGGRASAKAAQPSQRERLVDAMIELCAQGGYQAVTVAQVSSLAGVSSATFYEQFDGKEACLLAAFRSISATMLGRMQRVMRGHEFAALPEAALAELLEGVARDRDAAWVMFIEALGGGAALRDELTALLADLERWIEGVLANPPDGGPTLDLPAIAVVGAVRSIIARHLRSHSEDLLPSLVAEIVAWMGSYAIAPGRERWSAGSDARLAPAPSGHPQPPPAPERLPRGRHGLPASVVARSQRTRIIAGVAEVMLAKGYANATVTDIVTAAGVARDAFYQHFTDKQHAFQEAQQYPTQYMLDTCVADYFAADSWPERVWSGLRTLLRLIAENPAQSHLRLVEAYAAGPAAARRAEEITRSFTIFLEEGYRYRPQAAELPRVASQTIGGAVFEVVQRIVARGETSELPRYLPQLTYIAIAPFTGPREAVALLEGMRARDEAAESKPR